jgi:predicted RNA methylase
LLVIEEDDDGMAEDAKTRFSSRVENYVKYRPSYPEEVLSILEQEMAIVPPWVVADVGAGTGISSQLFLSAGHVVYAVEPNDDMRQAAEKMLGRIRAFMQLQPAAKRPRLRIEALI